MVNEILNVAVDLLLEEYKHNCNLVIMGIKKCNIG
jgi:hypothetical protein